MLFVWHSASQNISYFATALMMPIFAFVTGYSTKAVNLGSYSKKIFSIFIFAHFIIPFTSRNLFKDASAFNSLDGIVDFFLFKNDTGILWYLLAMLVWVRLGKILLKTKYPVCISIAGALLIFLSLDLLAYCKLIQDPLKNRAIWYNFANGVKFFPFYMVGLTLDWKKIVDMRYSYWKYFYGACLVGVIILFAKAPLHGKLTTVLAINSTHIFFSLIALVGIICVFPGRNIKTFTDIGAASLNIYILHFGFLSIFNYIVFSVFGVDFVSFTSRGIVQTLIDPISVLNLFCIYLVSWVLSQPLFMTLVITPSNWIDYILFDTKLPQKISAN